MDGFLYMSGEPLENMTLEGGRSEARRWWIQGELGRWRFASERTKTMNRDLGEFLVQNTLCERKTGPVALLGAGGPANTQISDSVSFDALRVNRWTMSPPLFPRPPCMRLPPPFTCMPRTAPHASRLAQQPWTPLLIGPITCDLKSLPHIVPWLAAFRRSAANNFTTLNIFDM